VEDEALLQYTSPFILFLHLHPLLLRGCVWRGGRGRTRSCAESAHRDPRGAVTRIFEFDDHQAISPGAASWS
jgi:hypothetical protein